MGNKPIQPKILILDGEMSDLCADMGELLIFGFGWLDQERITTFNITDTKEFKKDMLDDSGLLKKACEVIEKADMIVTHYGKKHDIPFIQTRLLLHGLPPLPQVPHIDLWHVCRFQLRLQSNRQANISEFLETAPKEAVSKKDWRLTRAGHVPTIKRLNSRCREDVRGLKENYLRIKPYMKQHPHLHRLYEKRLKVCPACGSDHFHRSGQVMAQSQLRNRYRCREEGCGHNWYTPVSH